MPGTRQVVAGRYRLVHPLAEGGFGRVWKAHDELLRADVVVKEVRLPPMADPEEQARRLMYAEREARHAARLRHHPGVVPVYDIAIEDGRPWIVMQLVDGESLEDRLDAGPLPVDEALELADALLQALDAAHRAGVVHRDVKPANVMLATDGRILLTDFGIATHPADTRLTVDGSVIGSLEYIAPERLNGNPARPAPAGDLFSLGVTLFQTVEGRSPFRRDSHAATIAAIIGEEPPFPRRAGRLTPLIRALLAKDPAARPTVTEALVLLHAPPSDGETRRDKPKKGKRSKKVASTVEIGSTAVEPFVQVWSGDEDPRGFATQKDSVLSELIPYGFGTALGLGGLSHDWKGNTPGELIIAGLVIVLLSTPSYNQWRARRAVRRGLRPRTLRIDQGGITATDDSGTQSIPWADVAQVGVRHTDAAIDGYRPLALHLKVRRLRTGDRAPVLYRPIGWPADTDLPEVCRGPEPAGQDAWVPVCVLGPVPEPSRVEFKNTVAAFTKRPLNTGTDW